MQAAVSIAFMLLAALGFAAAPPALERVEINGRAYVRLTDWARQNNLQASWISKQDLRLANNSASIYFAANSQKIRVNGVTVWLSVPVALHNNSLWVAPVDTKETLQPLFWPPRSKGGSRIKVICLDPGHGGKDTGNREGTKNEKDYTFSLARELAAQLRKAGYTVFLTRSWDTFVELDDRPELARRRGADLFISLHFNAAGSDAKGSEVYCLTPAHTASTNARGEGADTGTLVGNLQNQKNVLLAYLLQKSITGRLGMEDRGVRRARWAVLRKAQMPAALVEAGFMSNTAEAKNIYSSTWRRKLCEAIVEGVKSYARLVDPPKGQR